ncbi:MAG: Ppx/GppA family phosphatase [Prevotellaceae bacterium]|nr:Ppx/GppA family phosphatase [Prevotellaceae bacterium]
MNSTNLAAIDIGSNAARILIKSVKKTNNGLRSKKLQFLRIPLRLGMDVFGTGEIGEEREKMLLRTMKVFRQLLILYDVKDYRICATSAFREAKNGDKVLKHVMKETKLQISIISGDEEARTIRDNYTGDGNLLYMDVGGGSTELSLVCDGKLIGSKSFNIGTIRILNACVEPSIWKEMAEAVRELTKGVENIRIVGSGGNINKLYRLAPKKERTKDTLHIDTLSRIYTRLSALSLEQRMMEYDLRASRADVIVPAAQIFLMVANLVKADTILVPTVGLADGIINELASKL